MKDSTVLAMSNICKSFPGVQALQQVDFSLERGEIHALMGENGAGKSTLIKVLTGVYKMEAGEIRIEGIDAPVVHNSPQEAQLNGISTVYQEINLCSNITVAENVFLTRQPLTRFGAVRWKDMHARAKQALGVVGLDIDVSRPLGEYSLAVQQMVAIARAVDIKCKVLILDEPTSSLDDQEVKKLFSVMRELKAKGVAIIFVTHFLEQVYEICDTITVLRNGALVGRYPVAELPRVKLVSKMLGHEYEDLQGMHVMRSGAQSGKVDDYMVHAKGLGRTGMIHPFDIAIKKGEVVGLAGLLGSGRSELARLLFGAERADKGVLFYKGERVKYHAPIHSLRSGMAFLPEDRKEEGVIEDLSVKENLLIALQVRTGMSRLIPQSKQLELAQRFIDLLDIKTPTAETPVGQLSGGNQQKVILGRWLITNPEFLILDEPTRGIDVGTKMEIQKLILKLSGEGMTVMFISSELEEMLRTVTRLYILCDRNKVGELENTELTQHEVMMAIAGGNEHESARV